MAQSIGSAKVFGDKEDPRQRLRDLFGGDPNSAGQPPAPAMAWAKEQLEKHPTTDKVAAIRLFRRAEPQLTLKAATFLAQHVIVE